MTEQKNATSDELVAKVESNGQLFSARNGSTAESKVQRSGSGGFMKTYFVSMTMPNMADFLGDATYILDNGKSTWQENACEFSGRICYKSVDKMGNSSNFLPARIREGHEDIIEHIVVTIAMEGDGDGTEKSMHCLRGKNRHCEVCSIRRDRGDADQEPVWYVSANLRAWLDLFRLGEMEDALPILKAIAPNIFFEFSPPAPSIHLFDLAAAIGYSGWLTHLRTPINVAQTTDGPQRVTLLGANLPFDYSKINVNLPPTAAVYVARQQDHGSATFLFEGISRACTHQLVRHRLGSYSQESSRYVDLGKGGWRPVIPPSIMAKPEAAKAISKFWGEAENLYGSLRDMGIRKEDARFILPVAAETRVVVTMNLASWDHFLWLRADKASQWEIQALAKQVESQLSQIASMPKEWV